MSHIRLTYIGGPLNGMQKAYDKNDLPKSPHRVVAPAMQGLVVPDRQNTSEIKVIYTDYDVYRVTDREYIAVPGGEP